MVSQLVNNQTVLFINIFQLFISDFCLLRKHILSTIAIDSNVEHKLLYKF